MNIGVCTTVIQVRFEFFYFSCKPRLGDLLSFVLYLLNVCRAFTDVIASHPAANADRAMHFLSAFSALAL